MSRIAPIPRAGRSLVVVSVLFAGCDIPTESFQWDQRWVLPSQETTVGVAELLPASVSVLPDGTAFAVTVEPVVFQQSLGALCPLCAPLNGQTVPKPPFQGEFVRDVPFPGEVESGEVREGTVQLVVVNGFGFDPIRPSGGGFGNLTLTLRDGDAGGRLLAQKGWSGSETAFPPGSSLTGTLSVSGSVGSSILATVTIDSPAGGLGVADRVPVRLQDRLEVTASVVTLQVTSATVQVAGRAFDLAPEELDVGGLDQEIVDRIQVGALELAIVNPWSVGAELEVLIEAPALTNPIPRTVLIPASPTSVVRLEYGQEELRSFLGKDGVTFRGVGEVSSSAPPLTLTPDQVMILQGQLDLTLRIG